MGFPGGSEVKASASNAGDPGLIPGLGRSPGEGNGNPLQYSCLENPIDGESHGRRSLVGYSPWGSKESDKTERLHFHFLYLQQASSWATLSCIVRASHCGGFSPAAQGFWPMGSIVMACVLSCFTVCGIFPDPGSNQCSLHCITTGPPGKSEL